MAKIFYSIHLYKQQFLCILIINGFCNSDLDNVEALLKEYDDNMIHRATPDNVLGLIDASSLLWRLEVMSAYNILISIFDIAVCIYSQKQLYV